MRTWPGCRTATTRRSSGWTGSCSTSRRRCAGSRRCWPGVLARGRPTTRSRARTWPGRTWWPLGGRGDADRFQTWSELSTVFHEGVPGHHLQAGAAMMAGDRLSRYAKSVFVSGHGEGWALYAERLADELGWFGEPGTRLGMLSGSALRAARVVIDIGVHLDL